MDDGSKKDGGAGSPAATAMLFSNLSNFEGAVAQFDGEDKSYSSSKWAQDIEDNAEIFNWTPQQKLIIARRSLCGTAGLWLKAEKVFKTYDELKAALLKEFPEVINTKEMHELMAARRKKKDESFYQYMLAMKELGKRAKFPDYVAIQYIIDGIEDLQVNKTILYGVTTYSALKEKLVIYEKMQADMKKEARVESAVKRKSGASVSSSFTRRCYNCGGLHLASQCTRGIKCFRCNRFDDHIASKCPMIGRGDRGASASNGANAKIETRNEMSVKQYAAGPSRLRAFPGHGTSAAEQSVKQRSTMFGVTSANRSEPMSERTCGNDSEFENAGNETSNGDSEGKL